MWSWAICTDTWVLNSTAVRTPRLDSHSILTRFSLALPCALFVRQVCHLPEQPVRGVDRLPGESEWGSGASWPEYCVGTVRPRVPPGLHPEVAQNEECVPAVPEGMGLYKDREDQPEQQLTTWLLEKSGSVLVCRLLGSVLT